MSNPNVTIIVPVYKAENTLRRCVDSIISQKETDWELFLVDDGSPDDSGRICDSYSQIDKRITVIHKDNGGVSSARNAGIERANGKYISFVDSDDYIEKTFLSEMLKYSPSDLIICGFYNPEGEDFEPKEMSCNLFSEIDFVKNLIDNPFYLDSPWCKLFKSNIIKKNRLRFDERLKLSEDTLFSYQYIRECTSVSILPLKLYTYIGQWGGGTKYKLTEDQLIEASQKNVYAIKEVAEKFGIDICTRYKCFQYSKLDDVFKRYTDADIHRMYIQTHDFISIEEFLGDERLSPISLAIANINKLAKNGDVLDCKNALEDVKRFITIPIRKIKFSNRKHSYLMNSLYYLGAYIPSVLLTFITKFQDTCNE